MGCPNCMKSFVSPRKNAKFCSFECSVAWRRKTAKPKPKIVIEQVKKKRFKKCPVCKKEWSTDACPKRAYCSVECSNKAVGRLDHFDVPIKLSPGTLGSISELAIAVDLMTDSYDVFRALSPNCFCDLIAIKDDEVRKIEVRTGKLANSSSICCVTTLRKGATELAIYIPKTKEILYFKKGDKNIRKGSIVKPIK